MEATILNWLKKEGDTIEADEPVLEIATDKVDSEVPSPVSGILKKRLFKEGDVVPIGQAVALIETEAETGGDGMDISPAAVTEEPAPQPQPEPEPEPVPEAVAPSTEQHALKTAPVRKPAEGRFYSPLVLNIARKEGITMQELEALPGTGKNGRVTKKDILAFVERRKQDAAVTIKAEPAPPPEPTVTSTAPETPARAFSHPTEIEEMDRMRKLIAEHMVMSKHTSAHVTSFVEADVTNLVLWRNKVKDEFLRREGEKLTFTPLFIEAVVKALKEFPYVNASIDGTRIIKHKVYNIGMATALPTGNLIVPVIRNADQLNIVGLAKAVNDLAARARAGKLQPGETEGGTFTLTNVGTFGNVMGTPIINQPQVAILATGAIRKKPVVIETPEGDMIAIRHMMMLSHSYDHRLVDGAMGGAFVRRVADILEAFDPSRAL